MGKLVLIFLLCALVAICSADEAKKETEKPALETLQTTFLDHINEIKEYINQNIDPKKIQELMDKVASHTKTFVESTQKDFQTLNEKKA